MYPGYTLLCTLYTHCYDEPEYTLLVLIYIIVPYVPCIHSVMMTLDTPCYDDPGYTLLVLIYNIIPYIPWIYML